MNYEQLIETISLIVENQKIQKVGLTLVYELNEANHKQMNEILFHKSNPYSTDFIPSDEFEVTIGGILVKFIKPNTKIDLLD